MSEEKTLAPLRAKLLAAGCTSDQADRLQEVMPPINPTVMLSMIAKYGIAIIGDVVSLFNPATGPIDPADKPPVIRP